MDNRCELRIVRADDTSALFDFCCGVSSMDNFIHDSKNGLAKFIKLGFSNLWIVYEGTMVVAFFALSKDALVLNSEDRSNIEHHQEKDVSFVATEDESKFWDKEKYPAIEIDYFAVCQERRKSGLGIYLINEIAQMAVRDELSPTMFLTVEALDTKEYSAVEFYRKCDFDSSEKAKNEYNYQAMFGNQPTTRRMYRLIIPVEV